MIVDECKETGGDTVSLAFRLKLAPATANDVDILASALTRFDALKHWDRHADQDCDNDAPGSGSLFCVLQASVKAHMGRYHHAQPAIDIVRAVISERFRDRYAGHILVDFNNHAATTASDVRTLLELAMARARAEAGGAK